MSVELTDGNVADFTRSLEMMADTVKYCQTYFERQSEAMAAQHASDKVMYAPICTLLEQTRFKIEAMQGILSG